MGVLGLVGEYDFLEFLGDGAGEEEVLEDVDVGVVLVLGEVGLEAGFCGVVGGEGVVDYVELEDGAIAVGLFAAVG